MSGWPEEMREGLADTHSEGEAQVASSSNGEAAPRELAAAEPSADEATPAEAAEIAAAPVEPVFDSSQAPFPVDDQPPYRAEPVDSEPLLFESFSRPEYKPPPRIPNMGHVGILVVILIGAWIIAGAVSLAAIHFHLFGVTNTDQASTDIRYTLGGEVVLDFVGLAGCLAIFPPLWHRSFFNGISWRNARARRRIPVLLTAAFICFVLAIVNEWLMPGPADAPIDRVFRSPGAAWLLFAFGVTVAPFFEEIAFRGFLLPAFCTTFDWIHERATGDPPRPLDPEGQPQWSGTAMVIGSILTSIPFAGMHMAQTGNSLGPFILLICVSMVLCWARLGARSLAASIVVHASYNFMLFSLMLFGTGGFRHMDKM